MPLDEVKVYDPELHAFFNLNTPDDFRQAEAMARFEAGQSNNLSG
jgi:molybdopterin-guanine dinucleotide biosynthesis protein A